MKPFNIEEAKAGKPVQDCYGQSVEILKYGLKNNSYSIAGICTASDGHEFVAAYLANELFMAPEEKTLYLNIYPDLDAFSYETRKTADKSASEGRIACVKVTYTEGQFDE